MNFEELLRQQVAKWVPDGVSCDLVALQVYAERRWLLARHWLPERLDRLDFTLRRVWLGRCGPELLSDFLTLVRKGVQDTEHPPFVLRASGLLGRGVSSLAALCDE